MIEELENASRDVCLWLEAFVDSKDVLCDKSERSEIEDALERLKDVVAGYRKQS